MPLCARSTACSSAGRTCSNGAPHRRCTSRTTTALWILLPHDVWRRSVIAVVGLASRSPPIPPAPSSASLRSVLGAVAGLRLVDQPVGRDGGPAARVARRYARCLRTIARRTWLYFETFVTAEHNYPAAGQFPGDAASGRRPANVADQYRRLSPLGHLGARFRLDQSRRCRRAHRSDGRHDREDGATSRPSVQLVRDDDAANRSIRSTSRASTAATSPAI